MAIRRAIPQAPPPFTNPFVDAQGKITPAWQRWLLNSYAREGGPQDDIYTTLIQALVSSAQVSALFAQIDQQSNEIAELQAEARVRQGYDDQIEDLRNLIAQNQLASAAVQQQLEALQQDIDAETTQAVLTQVAGSSAAFASATAALQGLGGKQDTIAPGTTADYWRGDETFQTLNTLAVPELTNLYFTNARAITAGAGTYATIASLATVATTGAYADLTGKPTLGTAAAQNTGTSGANVPLLNAANTWAAVQTMAAPLVLPTYTVAGLPAAASNTNGSAIATDLLAPAIGTIVFGGGAVRGLVTSDGTNWRAS